MWAGEEVLFARSVPRTKEGVAALVELINPAVVKICGDATEALDQLVARERGPGDKAIILLSLLKVRPWKGVASGEEDRKAGMA